MVSGLIFEETISFIHLKNSSIIVPQSKMGCTGAFFFFFFLTQMKTYTGALGLIHNRWCQRGSVIGKTGA
jgi:hypothetical protein